MASIVSGNPALRGAIEDLRSWSHLHSEMISKFEVYQKTAQGSEGEDGDGPTGFQQGYLAEITYLQQRRDSLDALITCVERYGRIRSSADASPGN